jgi:uncharacterized Tic20 family protein
MNLPPFDSYTLKNEEKLMGLFSHLSLFLGGIALPIIFWVINKDKSKFVTFHALQALFFHLAYIALIVALVFFLVFAGLGMGLLTAASNNHSAGPGALFAIVLIAFYALLFIFIFGAMGYAIYMGIKAYNGELKKYPVIGNMVYKKVYNVN